MGKYILLVTLAGVLGSAVFTYQSTQTSVNTAREQAERERTVIARQIARSAFGVAESELQRSFEDWRVDRTGVAFDNASSFTTGSFDLRSTGPSAGPVAITATGHYDGASYEISAQAIRDMDAFAAVSVEGPVAALHDSSGGTSPMVSGRNAATHGRDAHGMRMTNASAASAAQSTFPNDEVVGVGGEGDIVHESIDANTSQIIEQIRNTDATHDRSDLNTGMVGSESNPALAKVSGDLTLNANIQGTGVLYVHGNLKMRGSATWNGMVIVDGQGANDQCEGEDDDDGDDEEDGDDDCDDDEEDGDDDEDEGDDDDDE